MKGYGAAGRRRRQFALAEVAAVAGSPAATRAAAVPRGLFIAAIGLSAFLLFTLELLAGRLVLPVFGGSPAVWTTALCFFTGTIFLGYLYAHVVAGRLGPRRGGIVHLAVAALAVVAALLAPADLGPLRVASLPEALQVLIVLAAVAFGPAFLLSTTSPLLSAWFARRGGDPWWLYAASNAASLVALVAYPFAIEPWVPLSLQRVIIVVALLLFALTLAAIVVGGRSQTTRPAAAGDRAAARLGWRRQVLWLAAACVPAGLLSATTSYLSTDLVSAPLLWVGPLAIYLASFVVAFSERGRRILPPVERLVPAAATLLWIFYVFPSSWTVSALLLVVLGSYAVVAIAVHGRLALDRPDEAHLTRFYVVTSAGGLLATAFVTLVAPVVFGEIYEFPLLLVGGLAVIAILPGVRRRQPGRGPRAVLVDAGRRLVPFAAVGGLLLASIAAVDVSAVPSLLVLFVLGAMAIAVARRPRIFAAATAALIVGAVVLGDQHPVVRVRTFFGVIEVRPEAGGAAFAEYSGTTLHGLQFIDARQFEPTTYYVKSGPLGDAFTDLRARTATASIGVVGLGVGTVAAYAQRDDNMTFFEIDPAIVDLARNAEYFRYLANAPIEPRIVLGDARLSLQAEPDGVFDLLVLDAFSSDAVPTHLLTREAMIEYMRTLRPGGVIFYHVSNRYYDLAGAVTATAWSLGLRALALQYLPGPQRVELLHADSSNWVVVGWGDDTARFTGRGFAPAPFGPVLSDDFSDILRTLKFP